MKIQMPKSPKYLKNRNGEFIKRGERDRPDRRERQNSAGVGNLQVTEIVAVRFIAQM